MTNILTILLQDPTIFKDATPFGTAIYGLLVVALVMAVIYLDRKLTKKDDEYKELAEKTMVVITEVKEKVLDIREYRVTVVTKLDKISEGIKDVENLINHKNAK